MKRKTEASPAELFRVEGIGAKGFGIIPRYAMCDPDLSWHGKVLYAYLCALAGSGNQTWPKKETVIGHLKIGNKTYHAAQKNLLDWGYITIQHTRQGNRQGVNIYTLVASPPKLSRTAALPPGNEMSNRVISTGLKGAGYGMLPKLVMQDDRLCPKSKLVYAYLSSYAGAGCCAFPAVSVALEQLSLYKDAWRKGIRELTQCEYLQVVQRRVKGKFDVYDYYLLDKPQQPKRRRKKPKPPEVRKQDTDKAPGAGFDTAEKTGPGTGFDTPDGIRPEAGFDTPEHQPEAGFDTTDHTRPETGSDTPERIHPEAGFDISDPTYPEAGFDTAGEMEPETGFDTTEKPAPEAGFDTPEATAVQCPQKPQAGFDTAEPPPASVFDTSETSPEAGLWQTGNDTAEASDTYYNYLSTDFSSNITPSTPTSLCGPTSTRTCRSQNNWALCPSGGRTSFAASSVSKVRDSGRRSRRRAFGVRPPRG